MSYRKGVRAEKKSRAWLEERGYFVVEARGSHGPCDLLAVRDHIAYAVQVKAGRRPSPAQKVEMRQAMQRCQCEGVLHYWKDRARAPEVERLV